MESVIDELAFLKSLMRGIALLFGDKCEVVLHDHKDQPYESTIVAIENGQITGRKIGDCGTNLGLQVLRGTSDGRDSYNYATQTKDGRVLRSSTIYIHDARGTVVGAMCINFDISDLMLAERALSVMCQNPYQANTNVDNNVQEVFVRNVNELIDTLIQEALKEVGKPVSSMSKEDKLKALGYLDKRGAFLIKKSGDKVSQYFDISKFTMYNYLESIRAQVKPDDDTRAESGNAER